MAPYRVMVRGTGFEVAVDDARARYGFYATRFVHAQDPDAAVRTALELLGHDPKLLAAEGQPPKHTIDTVERLGDDFPVPEVQPGLVLYLEDGSDAGAA